MAPGQLPNLLIIGAQKCGTTSLHNYLACHPGVHMSARKELVFFVAERNWPRGLDWYRGQFQTAATVRGESSPHYTMYPRHAGVPERIRRTLPDVKLIYIVRDPIERIRSHYAHNTSLGAERRSLDDALFGPSAEGYFVNTSRYFLQIGRYLEHFPADRLLIVDHDELQHARRQVLRQVFAFLGVDTAIESPGFDREWNVTERKRSLGMLGRRLSMSQARDFVRTLERSPLPWRVRWRVQELVLNAFAPRLQRPEIDPATRERLREALADDARQFRAFTGRAFERWSV